jgi:hypothetical protein
MQLIADICTLIAAAFILAFGAMLVVVYIGSMIQYWPR